MSEDRAALQARILSAEEASFEGTALAVYRYQLENNALYRRFVELLGRLNQRPTSLQEIPCLPISFFKTQSIQSGGWKPERIFSSSGTTGSVNSRHLVRDTAWYDRLSRSIFESFYGPLSDFTILALLPAYLERKGSSLVHMVQRFIEVSDSPDSGFYLYDLEKLRDQLLKRRAQGGQALLLGVSFALLDLAEQFPMDLSGLIVMETGGMKGRRREMTRPELHHHLTEAFHLEQIHSEYGMTELFSQAYSCGQGRFRPGTTLRVLPRQITDPLSPERPGRTAALNMIDLGNLDTCSFIATDDLGRCYEDGSFEVLGRMDGSDIRGCNLMVADFA